MSERRREKAGSEGAAKIAWSGVLTSVQPRIRLMRSFDQRSHTYQGYVLRVKGRIGDEEREFLVAIGEAAHEEHQFHVGDRVAGEGVRVADPGMETAGLYRVSQLKVLSRGDGPAGRPPPWHGAPVPLSTYRERGHRRLDTRTYESRCTSCVWGCRMVVEIIVDHWNPTLRRYRYETFCYGPLSCSLYRAWGTRKVPGRRGMTYEEEDWVDEEAISHRGPDE